MGLNIPGYTLFCMSGVDRPILCICSKNMNLWMLPGFSCRDLVAVLINHNEGEAERWLYVLLICLMIPRILPCQEILRNCTLL